MSTQVYTLSAASPKLPSTGLGFEARSVMVTNYTDQYVRVDGTGLDVPPFVFGTVLSLPPGTRSAKASLIATTPTVTGPPLSNANATLTFLALGPEYTAYFKQNYYLSLSPALTRATLATNGTSNDTNWGFGFRAALGKEWWVADHWGLGIVGHVSMSVNDDSGRNAPTWGGWAFTAAFSATYN